MAQYLHQTLLVHKLVHAVLYFNDFGQLFTGEI